VQTTNPDLKDDGLYMPLVGDWGLRKYELLQVYAQLFSSSMANKWDCRVYIDLFSGPGRARLKHSMRIIPTPPSLALAVSPPFNRYVFCDIDAKCVSALSDRLARDFPHAKAIVVPGDCNNNIPKILAAVPRASKDYTVLSFCFVDPFAIQNLTFRSIEQLSEIYVDFLVLIPAYLDARRNISTYLDPSNKTVENFLGIPGWRDRWAESKAPGFNFGSFIADQFGIQMGAMAYSYHGLVDTVLVRSQKRNLPLYRLAFFSRHDLGHKFWKAAMKYTQRQLPLFAS
jgi:three-Cys-motif partner protein